MTGRAARLSRRSGGEHSLDGTLVLVAPVADLSLARGFTASLGADWGEARVRYGDREFVG
ncbi:hypothetical protein ACGFYE_02490 [Streptomyces zaomyceticus]|uniref:hypothetical protein n=1 Tax=Streptomyces zaomyceticus TaxID=68286 RepID=UPI003724A276